MIVGNYSGGLSFFMGDEAPPDGTYEIEQQQVNIKVFPNPASEFLQITLEQTEDFWLEWIFIYDLSGKIFLKVNVQQAKQHTVNISNLPNGIYLLQIGLNQTGHSEIIRGIKFLKQ
jgi:hypothetical protein